MTSVFTPASSGEVLVIGPTRTVVKVAGASARSRLSVVEMHLPAGWAGPPPHVHDVVDHVWYVVAGQVDLVVGGARTRAGAGDVALIPRGVDHTFSTLDCGPATLLEVDTGRPLDGYFRDLEHILGTGPIDAVAVGEVMRRHDTRPVA